MSVTYNGKKPGILWTVRTATGAFLTACKDRGTRHLARVLRRDATISGAGFVSAGVFLNVSATAITGFIFSYGLPVAVGAGVLMGTKSYLAYRKANATGKKPKHFRDALIAVGAIGAGIFLLSSGSAAVVAMVVGVGAPVAAGTGVLFAVKSWMTGRKLANSSPAYNYTRKAEQKWLDKKERAPLRQRIAARISSALSIFSRKPRAQDAAPAVIPAVTQSTAAPRIEAKAGDAFAKTAAPEPTAAETAAAAERKANLQRRKAEGSKRFH